MTYPENIESKIGFDAVRELLLRHCNSSLGRSHAGAMALSNDPATIRRMLGQTAEMCAIARSEEPLPLGGVHDVRPVLMAVRVPGTYIPATDLPRVASTLGAINAVRRNVTRTDGDAPLYPLLAEAAEGLGDFGHVTAQIDRILDRHGEIRDNASENLANIRRALSSMSGTINSAMRRVIASAVADGYLDADTTPSVRDGRLVIPVAPMHKRRIQGIVHDESASGKTFFIEPAEVVEANNRLRELKIEERHEIVRILTALTDDLRPVLDAILQGLECLGLFDFINAKAHFALETGGEMPHLSDRPEIEWYHACHPILRLSLERHGKEIVPLDITLTPKQRLLVVSGPNAGGKSVTLKTVAIIQYMTQCGMLPTMYANSHIGVMQNIFIDIGDDQSIEDDLSTYSSHLRNMKLFLARGNGRTLALIDEFGGGTEPQIGGAIAQALLGEFNRLKMWGIITTHYHNLKQFAEETPGLVNGSMLYDRQQMQPLFRLAIGQPGSSFAIEIARKTGLPDSIIDRAKEIVGSEYVNLDKYLLDIARDRRYWENKRTEIHRKEKQLQTTIDQYQADADTLRSQRRQIIADARDEARKILDGSNAAIERTIREIRQSQADKEATRAARAALQEQKGHIDRAADTEHPLTSRAPKPRKTPAPKPTEAKKDLAPGDNVTINGGSDAVGTIESISGKNATVIFGNLRTTVRTDRLRHTIRKASPGAQRKDGFVSAATSEESRARQLNFSHEIDVRGMRTDEAVQAVTYFVDDAIQFNAGRIRILHGTGTGALRQYIRNYLDTVPAVARYHDEDVRLGGAGITVVEF